MLGVFEEVSSGFCLLVMLLGVLLMGCSPPTPAISPTANSSSQLESSMNLGQTLPISAQATIAGHVIKLEVARTESHKAMGLMYRTTLADNRGMLFLFEPPQNVNFWMKNVRIPLDMIFVGDGKVKAIAASVPPCNITPCPTYGSQTAVNQVIELRGGRATELGLKVGETVKIQYLKSTGE